MKICHISTAHPTFDTRIFHKECVLLAEAGFETFLIVGHDKDECVDGVNLRALAPPFNRLTRIIFRPWVAFFKALGISADAYHIHDPELLPMAFILHLMGRKVIYDSHEHYGDAIAAKEWLPRIFRKPIARLFSLLETAIARRLAFVAAATPTIAEHFEGVGCSVVPVFNYPLLREFDDLDERQSSGNNSTACYIGAISLGRCAKEIIEATDIGGFKLLLGGNFSPASLQAEVAGMKGWANVDYRGFLDRPAVVSSYDEASVGIILFKPHPNHMTAMPNKLFEYMAAGIPVITSDFPHFRKIMERYQCGLTADPDDPADIARAVREILDAPEKASEMGKNGRRTVFRELNFEKNFREYLLPAYQRLLQ